LYYFAYASNLSREQMLQRCPNSKPKFTATLPNYELIFTGWSRKWRGGTASIRLHKGKRVTGAIYEISERELKLLDKYEGYPTIYNRLNVIVRTEDGEPIEAVTYIKVEQSETTKPPPEYLSIIRQGYRDWEIV